MAKPELGTKRICPTTGKKFFDMNRDPVVSPYTGESFPRAMFEPVVKGAAHRAKPAAEVAEEEEVVAEETGAELVSLDEVAEAENEAAAADDDVEVEADDTVADDTFLEEEEEGSDDVADLIDGDIEDDEET